MDLYTFKRDRSSKKGSQLNYASGPYRNSSIQSINRTHSTFNPEHLWNILDECEIFPSEFIELLEKENINMVAFKTKIERQKVKVSQQMDSFKKQIVHNIDDLKLSIQAQLDCIYKSYMQKYSKFKGELMDIKHLRDQIELNLPRNNISKPNHDKSNSNISVIKSLENNSNELKKYHILSYIAKMQKQKIMPLNQISKQIIILGQYENDFFKNKELNTILNNIKEHLKGYFRGIYDKKYQYLKDPEILIQKKQQQSLLDKNNNNFYTEKPIFKQQRKQYLLQQEPYEQKILTKIPKISTTQKQLLAGWMEDLNISNQGTIKTPEFQEIILCALEVRKGQIAVGGKDGGLIIYSTNMGNRITSLRAHKTSICSLALVMQYGKLYLASGSDHGCSTIVLWDTNNWNLKYRFEGHKAAVTSIVDLKDNHNIISGSYDKRINIYNLDTGKLCYNLPANQSSVTGIILNIKCTKMISCGLDNCLTIWQIAKNEQGIIETMFFERIIENNTMICSLAGSIIHDNIIYIGTKDGKIKIVNIDIGNSLKTIHCCTNPIIQMLIFQRQSKPGNQYYQIIFIDYPFIICYPCKQENIKIVNCSNGKINNIVVKGYIQFGCGIGPKSFIMNDGRSIGMLSQSLQRKQLNIFALQLNIN